MNQVSFILYLIFTTTTSSLAVAQDATKTIASEATAARERAIENNADILSPIGFEKAEKAYKSGAKAKNGKRNQSRAIKKFNKSEALFQQSIQNAEVAKVALSQVLESREAADKSKARNRSNELWVDGEKYLGLAARHLEQGRRKQGMKEAEKAIEAFKEAELRSIKAIYLTEPRTLLAMANSQRTGKLAPMTMAKAQSLLDQAERKLDTDRYDTEEPERLSNLASYETRHAMNIANSIRLIEDGTRDEEQLILYWEEPLKRLAAAVNLEARFDSGPEQITIEIEQSLISMNETLTDTQIALDKKNANIASLEKELKQLDDLLLTFKPAAGSSQSTPDAMTVEQLFYRDEAVVLQTSNSIILRLVGLPFPSGSAKLPRNNTTLLKLSSAFRLFPDSKITIEGHTDSDGSGDENRRLSQARADALLNFSVAELDVPRSRINAIGYGETRPIASNDSDSGRIQNRRIDIVILPRH